MTLDAETCAPSCPLHPRVSLSPSSSSPYSVRRFTRSSRCSSRRQRSAAPKINTQRQRPPGAAGEEADSRTPSQTSRYVRPEIHESIGCRGAWIVESSVSDWFFVVLSSRPYFPVLVSDRKSYSSLLVRTLIIAHSIIIKSSIHMPWLHNYVILVFIIIGCK